MAITEKDKQWYMEAVKGSIVLRGVDPDIARDAIEKFKLRERLDRFPEGQFHEDIEDVADDIIRDYIHPYLPYSKTNEVERESVEDYFYMVIRKICSRRGSGNFSLGGYGEQSFCIQKTDDKWEVFDGERGNHYSSAFYDSLIEASKDLIKRYTLLDHPEKALVEFTDLLARTSLTK